MGYMLGFVTGVFATLFWQYFEWLRSLRRAQRLFEQMTKEASSRR